MQERIHSVYSYETEVSWCHRKLVLLSMCCKLSEQFHIHLHMQRHFLDKQTCVNYNYISRKYIICTYFCDVDSC
jgi:hypothetical protein